METNIDFHNKIKFMTHLYLIYSIAVFWTVGLSGACVNHFIYYCSLSLKDNGILGGRLLKDTKVAYILSLGVVKEFRKNGIGKCIAKFNVGLKIFIYMYLIYIFFCLFQHLCCWTIFLVCWRQKSTLAAKQFIFTF